MATPSDQAPASSEVPVAKIEHDNSQLEEFLEQNRSKLFLGVAAALIVIIAFVGTKYVRESGAAEAAGALTSAETIEELQTVVKDYPESVVAGTAELLIVGRLRDQSKDDEAYTALKAFVANRKDHPLYLQGVSDLGLQEHTKGNLDAAVSLLREASAAGAAPGFIGQTALQRLGDALTAQGLEAMKANDVEKAKSLFAEAQVAFEDLEARAGENTALNRTAKDRRERLPHLSIPVLTPAEGKAAAEAKAAAEPAVPTIEVNPGNAPTIEVNPDAVPTIEINPDNPATTDLAAPPIEGDEAPSNTEEEASLPSADLTPPEEASAPPAEEETADPGNN